MAVSNSPPAVEVEHLRVQRGGREVLHDLSLTVPRGRITGLLGPSGCGKTTLIRSIVGTQLIAAGSVRVLGEPAGSTGLRSRVGYVTQAPSIYDDLSITDNVAYFGALYGRSNSDVAAAISAVGLGEHARQRGNQLSGGQRTRASLACALVADPELLVLDEPTVGLDPVLRVELWNQFHALAAQGRTLLVSSHVMDEAEHCDRLLLMREGHLLAQLSPDELRTETGETSLENAFLALIRMGDPR
ncbi:ABC transporter ATP-binding protein [Nocardia terpenica]|uniref:Multidrug ABC transporter ATP-binding protein n=1 Tax=Nocardia terpenica TaxID=455432 RepID=A0A164MPT5_9NOCA|nr:ABC transporter ATP-binding protein [Nocardia terpenica]KZM73552.1 multidrug ABC transporter ATP-binding protein [Nocardia terpenica]MBF6066145.1 ABC transporter ATP-binding protein [Nocardia terpenica]MBF6109245.1 ABC transporter ATP-binding protein [Nocardia terpenica]MBF6116449.1 ABC transporter ATP-binding protein [Nocardia terpenica]MBF6123546.1 ABC transporter ATP-binding protein [Nocardia terpenica]